MQKAFAKLTTLFVIISYSIGQRSQHGGQLWTPQTTEGNANSRKSSILRDVQTSFENNQVTLVMGGVTVQSFNISVECYHGNNVSINVFITENQDILQLSGSKRHTFTCEPSDNEIGSDGNILSSNVSDISKESIADGSLLEGSILVNQRILVELKTILIGKSSLVFEINDVDKDINLGNSSASIDVLIVKEILTIDVAFLIGVYILEILEMMTFGTQLDFDIVKHTLRTPIPILIGLVCQYVGMPLIAFGIARAVAPDSLSSFGIFLAGVCPGGGSSNIYTYLLDGDLSLSITMTTFSTMLSLAMLPLWLYTLGGIYLEANELHIPYAEILLALSVILVPLSVGLFIRNKFPRVARFIEKVMSCVLTLMALALITIGIISCMYLFKMFNLTIVVVGSLLPYIGFCLGAVVAFACRQTTKVIKTVAIETGMQNTGIAIILLLNSFPAPFGDIATVAPMAAEVMSPIPPFCASLTYLIWKTCFRKYKKVELSDSENDSYSAELQKYYNKTEKFARTDTSDVTQDSRAQKIDNNDLSTRKQWNRY